ncbi:MAG: hypothetical protein IT373_23875 [Polyangiaceae bacterium]|nr:hypothetical protein [Polyangiaceae bacterium]
MTASLRIDDMGLCIERAGAGATTLGVMPLGAVTAATAVVLPAFEGWLAGGTLALTLAGRTRGPLELALEVGGRAEGAPRAAALAGEPDAAGTRAFSVELRAPLTALWASVGETLALAVLVASPAAPAAPPRRLDLFDLTLVPVAAPGPGVVALELSDVTDAELYAGAERRSFDLQSPEEGFWRGSGKALLRLVLSWSGVEGPGYALDTKLERLGHAFVRDLAGRERTPGSGPLVEDASQRFGEGATTRTELVLDTGHAELGAIPEEGRNVVLGPVGSHALSFGTAGGAGARAHRAELVWRAPLPVRLRDPRPLLKTFQRLSAVGIDFGTSATVAALVQRGYRSLLQLGRPRDEGAKDETLRSAENPTVLLVDDHERLWEQMAAPGRFPYLVRVLRGSHAAVAKMADAPNAAVGQLKTLPERVLGLDESPQLRDREKQKDFLLDEARVRALLRAYAYLLGRAINRPGQDIYLRYVLTHPSKGDAKIRQLIEEELHKGLLLSLPEDVPASELVVEVVASEAEAFAVEVCPELCAHPDLAPLLEKHGELRFVVFDLGGGTLDLACGTFRPATEAEQAEHGSSTVIETVQVNGQPDLGGELLTHELAWLVHQHPSILPEMESREVPMMRPVSVPVNHLARRPELYKRGLAARQNWLRIERALGLERVKFGRHEAARPAPGLRLARLDGTETVVESLGRDLAPVTEALRAHLVARIGEGTKLLASTVASARWPGEAESAHGASLAERGVVVLLAGNSSRSAFVAEAVATELGLARAGEGGSGGDAPFEPWRPDGKVPLRGVVLYETPPHVERGVTMVGVTPKTAVALGALKLANHEVHLVRATQGFGYFLGDLRGFPPKFTALVPMGAPSGPEGEPGPHLFDFGRWDTKMPLRLAREYVPGKMTSNDPRVFLVPTGLPPGQVGRLYVAVVSPDEVVLCLDRSAGPRPAGAPSEPGAEEPPLVARLTLSKLLR